MNNYFKLKVTALVFYILSVLLGIAGYYKMFFYSNSKYYGSTVNAYVGADAYNYIINASYATGFYVLGIGCMISGTIFICTYILLNNINKGKTSPLSI